MPTVTSRWPVLLGLALIGGCAVVKSLDFPATEVKLVDHERTGKFRQVWLSPVDSSNRHSTDAKRVCGDKDWHAPVNAQGVATFEMKSSSHVLNMLAMDSTLDKMEKMNRGFAICVERQDDGVEVLMSTDAFDMMFAAGATLHVDCQYSAGKWTCSSELTG